jgi:hypothetical protein
MLTTLQFSSDQLELVGFDPQFLKARLKIKALQRVTNDVLSYDIRFGGNSWVKVTPIVSYVDPDTGQSQLTFVEQ